MGQIFILTAQMQPSVHINLQIPDSKTTQLLVKEEPMLLTSSLLLKHTSHLQITQLSMELTELGILT